VIKAALQRFLRQAGVYNRLKTSWVYDVFWRVADPRIIQKRSAETVFYRELLQGFRPGDLIFDVGANHGQKVDVFLRLGARVIAVEPDELNQRILREKFLAYRASKKPVIIVPQAVSEDVRTETMWIDEPGSAKNTLSGKWVQALRTDEKRFGTALKFGQKRTVETTTLQRLIEEFGRPYFIKIDVEGHEPSVLAGLREPVPFVSFEVNLPEFLDEGLKCINLLHALAPKGRFNMAAECEDGLLSKEWLPTERFRDAFATAKYPCVEVFWSSGDR
jgi:FkbM family methyltransferase